MLCLGIHWMFLLHTEKYFLFIGEHAFMFPCLIECLLFITQLGFVFLANIGYICACVQAQSLSHVWLCDPMDCSPLGSSAMGFFRQEYWSRLSFPPPGDLPYSEIKLAFLVSPALARIFFTRHLGSPWLYLNVN